MWQGDRRQQGRRLAQQSGQRRLAARAAAWIQPRSQQGGGRGTARGPPGPNPPSLGRGPGGCVVCDAARAACGSGRHRGPWGGWPGLGVLPMVHGPKTGPVPATSVAFFSDLKHTFGGKGKNLPTHPYPSRPPAAKPTYLPTSFSVILLRHQWGLDALFCRISTEL